MCQFEFRRRARRGHVIGGEYAGRGLDMAENIACDRHLVDLGRAIDDAHFGDILPHVHQRRFVRHAERAVEVQRAVNHVLKHAGHHRLHRRNLAPHRAGVGLVAV